MLNIELIKTRGEVYMMDDKEMVVMTDVDAKHYRKSQMGRFNLVKSELVDDIEEARMMLDMQGYIQL